MQSLTGSLSVHESSNKIKIEKKNTMDNNNLKTHLTNNKRKTH